MPDLAELLNSGGEAGTGGPENFGKSSAQVV